MLSYVRAMKYHVPVDSVIAPVPSYVVDDVFVIVAVNFPLLLTDIET